MEILQFIFKDFWHFAGTVILICVLSEFIESLLESIRYLFCKHEFEFSTTTQTFKNENDTIPIKSARWYICKKCGKIKKIKSED